MKSKVREAVRQINKEFGDQIFYWDEEDEQDYSDDSDCYRISNGMDNLNDAVRVANRFWIILHSKNVAVKIILNSFDYKINFTLILASDQQAVNDRVLLHMIDEDEEEYFSDEAELTRYHPDWHTENIIATTF